MAAIVQLLVTRVLGGGTSSGGGGGGAPAETPTYYIYGF